MSDVSHPPAERPRAPFRPELRERRQALFGVGTTATGDRLVPLEIGGRAYRVYSNVNLSVYSAQSCNARCPFCVEELRPASRGRELQAQRRTLADDERYFAALTRALKVTAPLRPSVSVTGGEPSKDPRLPRILETLSRCGARKRTMTTNASGLLDPLPEGVDVLDRVLAAGLSHLNVSRAHEDDRENQRLMRIDPFHSNEDLARVLSRARAAGARPRLSRVLLRDRSDTLDACVRYLEWAISLGVDNVVFRRLMGYDAEGFAAGPTTRFTDAYRAPLVPLLEAMLPSSGEGGDPRFRFTKQVVGYYYYVEVYRYEGTRGAVDVVLEEADLSWIERRKALASERDVIHELIFHPDGSLSATWQPWDGVLLPSPLEAARPPALAGARE